MYGANPYPHRQFSVDALAVATVARWVSEGFDSPGVRVRLPGAPGGKSTSHEWEQSDGVGSPERSPSSRDVVIACVVSSQKRGVDMTRGYYVSAAYGSLAQSGRAPAC